VRLEVREELCSGCRVCEVVCALRNLGEVNPKKAALAVKGHFPVPGRYTVTVCDQCGACAEVCPAEAYKEKDGCFEIDRAACTGCFVCVEECPRGVLRAPRDGVVPIKCVACGECVRYCPRNAIIDADGDVVAEKAVMAPPRRS
jgi:Fe-S-cluster-containing hydrogenase component 2